MNRLLIATTNPAKLAEYRLILRDLGIELELVSLADVGIVGSPEETGATFTENALIKARYYFECARIATLADDGGLEIDALGGEPGVRSHRWLGTGGDDSECHSKGSNACALPMPCETSWHLPEARGHSPKATGSVHKLRINRPYFINVGYRRHAMIASTAHARGICNQARRPGMRRRAAPKGSPGGIQGLPVRSSM